MGCHTWFSVKENRTIEEARRLYIQNQKEWISTWQFYIDNHCAVPFEKYTMDRKLYLMELYKRQLRMVEKGLCNYAVMNKQDDGYYIPGKGFYKRISDYHDLFRIGGYPDDRLFSLDETLAFIDKYEKQYGEKVEIYHITGHEKNTLEEFWEKYPEGSIHFG